MRIQALTRCGGAYILCAMDAATLIEELLRRGFTQHDIARETGITQPTISRVRRGEHGDPRLSTFAALKAMHERTKKAR